jgi:preprotein translocase subunit SecF
MKLLKLVPDDTNIKFLKLRIPFFVLSLVLIIGSWTAVAMNGLNFGVDFAGGQEVRMTFKDRETAPIPSLRELVGGLGYGEPVVQEFGGPQTVSIRVALPEGAEDTPGAATAIGQKVIAAIAKEYPDVRTDGNDTVSGKVAGEFRDQAILALLAAMAAVSIYIWVRFEWQFGVGAMFALVHDVSVTVGLFAITQMEFSLQIVAAILAIIGYSLNDTVVVYDRIRENLKKFRKMPLPELLDLSVNETLSRTVMTAHPAAGVRPAEPVRHGRRDHHRPVHRRLFERLHGRPAADLDGGDLGQLRADRKRDGPAGKDRPRGSLGRVKAA